MSLATDESCVVLALNQVSSSYENTRPESTEIIGESLLFERRVFCRTHERLALENLIVYGQCRIHATNFIYL